MGQPQRVHVLGGALTVAAGQTVRGTGYLLAVVNQGLVQADVSGQYIIFEDSAVNSGTVKAVNGANLEVFQTTLNNTGGTIQADDSTVYDNGSISGGTLTFTQGATLQGNGSLANVTVPAGSALLYVSGSNGNTLTVSGTLTDNGTVELDPAADFVYLQCNGNTTLAGTGQLMMDAGGKRAAGGFYYALVEPSSSGGTLTVAAGQTVRGTGYLLAVVNQGLVQADVSGQYIIFEDSAVNSGTVKAVNGANLEVFQTTLNNTGGSVQLDGGTLYNNGGTLTGGLLDFSSGATLQGSGTLADVTVPAGSDLLLAPSASLTISGTLTNEGVVEVPSGTVTLTGGTLDNSGTVQLDGGTLTIASSVMQVAGNTLTGGIWSVLAGAALSLGSAAISINKASITLSGAGSNFAAINGLASNAGTFRILNGRSFTTAGDLSNTGNLTVGAGSKLSVTGNYSQSSTGSLAVQLGGTPASKQFGQLVTSHSAALDGTLAISIVNGYGPRTGDSFQVMRFGSHSGNFAAVTGLTAGRLQFLKTDVTSTNVVISALLNAADLAVDPASINAVPAGGNAGITLNISYTVHNLESTPTWVSSWVDSIYLSQGTTLDSTARLIGRVQHSGVVDGKSSYQGTLSAPLPGAVPGSYHIIVVCDSRGLVPDIDRSNNTVASSKSFQVDIVALTPGVTASGTITAGEDAWFRVDLPAQAVARVTAAFGAAAAAELYVRYQDVPDQATYDQFAFDPSRPQQQILLTATQAGTYYILLHGREGSASGQPFTLTVQQLAFAVVNVTPKQGSAGGPVTIAVQGSQLTPSTVVSLVAPDRTRHPAVSVLFQNSNSLFATFDLTGLSLGTYDVRVDDQN